MNTLIRRISHYVSIDSAIFNDLSQLKYRLEERDPDEIIVRVAETVNYVFVIEEGWAIRYRVLDDGRRQILNFMLPGDCFDLMSMTGAKSDHAISAVTKVKLRRFDARAFLKIISSNQKLAAAFWWTAIQEEAILREQIIRVGRRSARERIAHLILELNRRIAAVEGQQNDVVNLPLPQTLLADALGLSVVHVSRTLSKLRQEGLIRTFPHGVELLDRKKMACISDFDSAYLHLEHLKLNL